MQSVYKWTVLKQKTTGISANFSAHKIHTTKVHAKLLQDMVTKFLEITEIL